MCEFMTEQNCQTIGHRVPRGHFGADVVQEFRQRDCAALLVKRKLRRLRFAVRLDLVHHDQLGRDLRHTAVSGEPVVHLLCRTVLLVGSRQRHALCAAKASHRRKYQDEFKLPRRTEDCHNQCTF